MNKFYILLIVLSICNLLFAKKKNDLLYFEGEFWIQNKVILEEDVSIQQEVIFIDTNYVLFESKPEKVAFFIGYSDDIFEKNDSLFQNKIKSCIESSFMNFQNIDELPVIESKTINNTNYVLVSSSFYCQYIGRKRVYLFSIDKKKRVKTFKVICFESSDQYQNI